MKKLIIALFLVNVAIFSLPAHSLSIDLNDSTTTTDFCITCTNPNMWTGTTGPYAGVTENLNEAEIAEIVGYNDTLVSLYKSDVEGADLPTGNDSGLYADDYLTLFSNTPTDPSGSLTTFIGNDVIACGDCYLYVKDGNNDPFWYVFDISGWAGDDITLANFWPVGGAISHVEILGTTASVPEPSVMALLGIGLFGMIGVSRRRKV